MRMDRLLNMVVLLVNRKRIKAKELAEHFGISVRTVYRDVDTICQAGIPVITYPGLNGGLGIAEGYRLDRTVLSEEELASVMVALKSVSTSLGDTHTTAVQQKIQAVITDRQAERFRERTESIRVDFSPWGSDPRLKGDVEALKEAIESKRCARFIYCNAKGERMPRQVEPYTLVLKNRSWYLYAYCLTRVDFRFFKLARIRELQLLEDSFVRRDINLDELPWEQEWRGADRISLVLRFRSAIRPLVEDWFGVEQVEDAVDTTGEDFLIVRTEMPEDEWLNGFLLSFGDRMEILEPAHFRQKLKNYAERVVALYS